MVNDFMVCVDRILASASCYDSVRGGGAFGGGEEEAGQRAVMGSGGVVSSEKRSGAEGCSEAKQKKGEAMECRICQEEDEEREMEAPCACSGTLKFAHRKCIQKWCNKKGDITCEICSQVYSPNYSLPPARSNPDVLSIDIRQAWGVHIDLRDPHLLAIAAAERQLLESDNDNYAVANSSSIVRLRSVTLILLIVMLVHQAIMAPVDFGIMWDASTHFNFQVTLLQLAGFLLPCYVIARAWYLMQSRRRQQG